MMRWACRASIALCVLLDPISVTAQTWSGYYLGTNLGGRFAINDWTASLA
jgi:hypothetical protein